MQELITEIAIYLGLAAFLGFLLGYLIWGMGTRRRITAARAEGAADARTSVAGDRSPQSRIDALTRERDQLARRVDGLKKRLAAAEAQAATPRATAPSDPRPEPPAPAASAQAPGPTTPAPGSPHSTDGAAGDPTDEPADDPANRMLAAARSLKVELGRHGAGEAERGESQAADQPERDDGGSGTGVDGPRNA